MSERLLRRIAAYASDATRRRTTRYDSSTAIGASEMLADLERDPLALANHDYRRTVTDSEAVILEASVEAEHAMRFLADCIAVGSKRDEGGSRSD